MNLFHGRIEDGRVFIGDTALEIDREWAPSDGRVAMLYIRPHMLEVDLVPHGTGAFGYCGERNPADLTSAWR